MKWVLVLVFCCAGCVPADQVPLTVKGQWADYHAFVAGIVADRISGQPAPEGLAKRLETCWADDTISALTPDELDTLNRFARGESQLTNAQLTQLTDTIETRRRAEGKAQPGLDRLTPTCPSDIAEFKKYFTVKTVN